MAHRIYTVEFGITAVTVAADLFELTPVDDKPIEVLGMFLSQTTEVGDAQDEMLPYRVVRGHTTSGSGGTAATPRALDRSGAGSGFTAEVCNTTAASVGTTHNLHTDAFNVRAGLPLWLPEDCTWEASQADTTLVVRMLQAPTDSISLVGTVYVREQG